MVGFFCDDLDSVTRICFDDAVFLLTRLGDIVGLSFGIPTVARIKSSSFLIPGRISPSSSSNLPTDDKNLETTLSNCTNPPVDDLSESFADAKVKAGGLLGGLVIGGSTYSFPTLSCVTGADPTKTVFDP